MTTETRRGRRRDLLGLLADNAIVAVNSFVNRRLVWGRQGGWSRAINNRRVGDCRVEWRGGSDAFVDRMDVSDLCERDMPGLIGEDDDS